MDINQQSQQTNQSAEVSSDQPQIGGQMPAQNLPSVPSPALKANMAIDVPTQEEKTWAVLSYLPMVALVTLVLKPNSQFCRLHGTQGLVLTVLEFMVMFVWAIIPTFGSLFVLLLFVLVVYGAFKALSGVAYQIPGVYQFAKLVPVDALTAGLVAESTPEASKPISSTNVVKVTEPVKTEQPGPEAQPQKPMIEPEGEVQVPPQPTNVGISQGQGQVAPPTTSPLVTPGEGQGSNVNDGIGDNRAQ